LWKCILKRNWNENAKIQKYFDFSDFNHARSELRTSSHNVHEWPLSARHLHDTNMIKWLTCDQIPVKTVFKKILKKDTCTEWPWPFKNLSWLNRVLSNVHIHYDQFLMKYELHTRRNIEIWFLHMLRVTLRDLVDKSMSRGTFVINFWQKSTDGQTQPRQYAPQKFSGGGINKQSCRKYNSEKWANMNRGWIGCLERVSNLVVKLWPSLMILTTISEISIISRNCHLSIN
jgi:hypothetical protein